MSALINISSLNRAFKNVSVSNTTFATQQTAYAADATAFANSFNDAALSDAALANLVLTNMGILPSTEASVQALEPALAEYFAANGNRGVVVMQLAALLSDLENATGSLAVYKSAAAAWNQEVVNAAAYSSNVANTVDSDKPAAGGAYTLTTGTDTFVGTAGNDTFTAAASDDTINATDFLVDNSSTDSDTLNITGKAFDTTVVSTGSIRGIEQVNVNFDSLSDSSFNAAGIDTASTITVAQTRVGSGAAVAVDNVLKGSTVVAGAAVNSLTATADADGNLTVTGADATTLVRGNVSGTGNVTVTADKSATVTAVSAKAATVSAAAAAAVNVTGATVAVATGTKDVLVTLTGTADTKDTASFTASKDLTIANQATNVETITVAGSGAAVVATVTTTAATTYEASGDQAVTFAGADTMFTNATVKTSGTGTTTLKLSTLDNATNLSKAAVNKIVMADATSSAVTLTLSNSANLQLAEGVNAAVTLAADDNVTNTSASYLKGTLNLELAKNTATANAITVTNSSAGNDGFDTVNLSVTADSTGTTNNGVKLVAGTAAVIATGAKKLILTGDTTAKSLDASAMTGAVTVTFDGTSDIATVKTGSGNDTVTLSTAKVSVDTGAGNDAFTLSGNLATDMSVVAGDGTDVLTLGASSQIQAASVTGIEIFNLAGYALQAKASTFSESAAVVQSTGAAAITLKSIGSSVDLSNVTFEHASNGTFTVDFSTDLASTLGTSSNFTATGSSHADTITTGNGVNTVNAGDGNDSITGGNSVDTINGGKDADTIDGGTGADVLTGGEGADAITGGGDNDTIVLTETTAAVDTVVFAATAANNGSDTITSFATADLLSVNAFLGLTDSGVNGTTDEVQAAVVATAALTGYGTGTSGGTDVTIGSKIVKLSVADIADSTAVKTALADAIVQTAASTNDLVLAASSKAILVVGETTGTDGVNVYYVTTGASGVETITQVASLTGICVADVAAANFM